MLNATEFYPWQIKKASTWLAKKERFSHAWLIHGMAGIGKQQFAIAAASSLLCNNSVNGLACGQCESCRWVLNGSHPDVRRIRPDLITQSEVESGLAVEDAGFENKSLSQEIRIDQLRELTNWFNTATHGGGWRVAVLYPAQSLNLIAANALLKVLEEPPVNTVFLLVANAPDRLIPTIVSRCRKLPLPVPTQQESIEWLNSQGVNNAEQWLAATSRAPVFALNLSKESDHPYPDWLNVFMKVAQQNSANPDVREIVQILEKTTTAEWIDHLQKLFIDFSLWHQGLQGRYFPSLANAQELGQKASFISISNMLKELNKQRSVARHPLSAKLHIHNAMQQAAAALNSN